MSFFKLMNSLLFFTLISISISITLISAQKSLSAYDLLQQYGFPVGILPIGATGYKLNRATGEFSLYLNQKCRFSIDSYDLEYKQTVQGVISRGRLSKLKGVSVKILFVWLNIVEVRNGGDELEFSIGVASAKFGIDSFYESPQCGCGFKCGKVESLVADS